MLARYPPAPPMLLPITRAPIGFADGCVLLPIRRRGAAAFSSRQRGGGEVHRTHKASTAPCQSHSPLLAGEMAGGQRG